MFKKVIAVLLTVLLGTALADGAVPSPGPQPHAVQPLPR